MNNIIAVPSENPGGLDAAVGNHFGHCDLYTLVSVENGEITDVRVLPNIAHEHGGCLAPVQLLADKGITALLAGGMGMRPLMAFNQAGIGVYHTSGTETVGKAVQAMLEGQLQQFQVQQSCSGCHGH